MPEEAQWVLLICTNWEKEHLLKPGARDGGFMKILRMRSSKMGGRRPAFPECCHIPSQLPTVSEIVEAILYLKSVKQNWQLRCLKS